MSTYQREGQEAASLHEEGLGNVSKKTLGTHLNCLPTSGTKNSNSDRILSIINLYQYQTTRAL